ncbi:MAG: response regulator [Rhodocyclaceae bacterium]|nr:response regulator [Rhodocyclaceae bacterium]
MLIDPHLYESKILVCDDSPSHAALLHEVLTRGGVREVVVVNDPRRVLPTLSGHGDFDLLLLDLEMPHLHGFEVMELLRSELAEEEQVPIIVVTGIDSDEVRLRALELGANDFVRKPFDETEVILRVRNTLRMQDSLARLREVNRDLEAKVQERTRELDTATATFVHKLGEICEMCDRSAGPHIRRVGRLAGLLAQLAELPEETAQLIERAAPLHDVGKVMVPDELLMRPGKLTEAEFEQIKRHAGDGSLLLDNTESPLVRMAADIAASHHERWDGTGYPNGLRGEEIPLEGRITAICDVFDALVSARPYKDPWSVQNAVDYLIAQSGKQFDPHLVDLFVANLSRIETLHANACTAPCG